MTMLFLAMRLIEKVVMMPRQHACLDDLLRHHLKQFGMNPFNLTKRDEDIIHVGANGFHKLGGLAHIGQDAFADWLRFWRWRMSQRLRAPCQWRYRLCVRVGGSGETGLETHETGHTPKIHLDKRLGSQLSGPHA